MEIVEHSLLIEQEKYFFEERLVLEGENHVVSIVRDITEWKNFETKLEYLSFHDKLTGLYNRNYFEQEMKRLENSRDYPISIISADANGLKLINDTFGHPVGDKLLVECGRVLKESLRSSDILARVGGDEFVAILPRTSEKDGQEVIKRIKANLLQHNKEFPSLPLSLSIGLATAENSSQGLMDTCKEADERMYKEKKEKKK